MSTEHGCTCSTQVTDFPILVGIPSGSCSGCFGYVEPYLVETDYWAAMPVHLVSAPDSGWGVEIGPYVLDRHDIERLQNALDAYRHASKTGVARGKHHISHVISGTDQSETAATVRQPQHKAGIKCVKILHPDGTLARINAAGRAALGISPLDTQLGMPWLEVLPSAVRDSGRIALDRARNGTAAQFPGLSVEPDGTTRRWANELTPIEGIDGQVTEILCISTDITELPGHRANRDNPGVLGI